MELYKKHRPITLNNYIGQDPARELVLNLLDGGNFPAAVLISGPSGCGKTTLGRIIANSLGCSQIDFTETNAANTRGIDEIRKIRERAQLAPMGGDAKVWLIDEAHGITKDGQDALLKVLEDSPRNVHFVLCTTEPEKLRTTIKNRCTHIKLKPLSVVDIEKLLVQVSKSEGIEIPESVVEKIADAADGSPRKA